MAYATLLVVVKSIDQIIPNCDSGCVQKCKIALEVSAAMLLRFCVKSLFVHFYMISVPFTLVVLMYMLNLGHKEVEVHEGLPATVQNSPGRLFCCFAVGWKGCQGTETCNADNMLIFFMI